MKLFSVIFLLLLYACTTSGMAINVHYCKGKVASTELENFKQDVCKKCGTTTKSNCCKTELKVIKLNAAHQQVVCAALQHYTAETLCRQAFERSSILTALLFKQAVANAPPLVNQQPAYLKNCVLLI